MLTEPERDKAQRLFAKHGYSQPLRVAPVTSEDERIFAVTPATLTGQLQQALHRKIWIVGEGPARTNIDPLR